MSNSSITNSDLFNNHLEQATCTSPFLDEPEFPTSEARGVCMGVALAALLQLTGVGTALHEVVGHGQLGFRVTHHYPNGEGPRYQVDGWDNLKAIGHAKSVRDFFIELGRFLIGYDRNHDGYAGRASRGNGTPNQLKESMGFPLSSAWISIAGSIPGMVVDGLMVAGGMQAKKHHPIFGYMLISYGLTDHFISSFYAWDAASMSAQSLAHHAARGHDFANLSIQMGNITGISPQAMAITTATLWTAIVPAIALSLYFYQKKQATEIVPDYVGLQHWLSTTINHPERMQILEKAFTSYPERERLLTSYDKFLESRSTQEADSLQVEMRKFSSFLVEKLPSKTLKEAKKEVLRRWEKNRVLDRNQKILSFLSILGKVIIIAAKIMILLSYALVPSLGVASSILGYTVPFFIGAAILSNLYTTYKDLKSPDRQIPKHAKIISVTKLIVAIATEVGICVGFFLPGMNVILVAFLVVGPFTVLACDFARQRVIRHRFQLLLTLEDNNWSFMHEALMRQPKDKELPNRLSKWVAYQQEAQKLGFLDANKQARLAPYLPSYASVKRGEKEFLFQSS